MLGTAWEQVHLRRVSGEESIHMQQIIRAKATNRLFQIQQIGQRSAMMKGRETPLLIYYHIKSHLASLPCRDPAPSKCCAGECHHSSEQTSQDVAPSLRIPTAEFRRPQRNPFPPHKRFVASIVLIYCFFVKLSKCIAASLERGGRFPSRVDCCSRLCLVF